RHRLDAILRHQRQEIPEHAVRRLSGRGHDQARLRQGHQGPAAEVLSDAQGSIQGLISGPPLVQFTKLRLAGFKSFVDPTELLIYPGLTGIVGPNGCGKSNLVEALRWAMGETSPKSMRGGEMEDVIFGGSTTRPARNIAEVVLSIENRDRKIPAHFNDSDELEISRRIERGSGSSYSVNGHEVRARDVQLLFADSATGAHSTALVSQGRVGALINAKPTDRRALLEEAAGITGLHSRRHEADLRLRAAEANLARLDDVIVTLESQLQTLKKQARQATRYRNLNDHIRRVEATLLHLLWRQATPPPHAPP